MKGSRGNCIPDGIACHGRKRSRPSAEHLFRVREDRVRYFPKPCSFGHPPYELRKRSRDRHPNRDGCPVDDRQKRDGVCRTPPLPSTSHADRRSHRVDVRKGELEREIDDAVENAVTKKNVTTQVESGLIKDSSLLKSLALSTQKQVEKSLKEFKLVEELNESARKVTKSNPGNLETGYLTEHTLWDCVHCAGRDWGAKIYPHHRHCRAV